MLFRLRAEAQLVYVVDDLAQVVAAGDFVFDLPENLPDFIFDGVRPGGPLGEAVQIGKQLLVDEIAQVITGLGLVVVELAITSFGCGPGFPSIGLVKNVGIFLPAQGGFVSAVLLKTVEIFQKQQP